MRAPTHNAGHGENRRVQLARNTQHLVHKSAVEVDIGAGHLAVTTAFRYKRRSNPFDRLVQVKILRALFFLSQHFNVTAENAFARIGKRIDRMAHAVDEALMIERLLVQDFTQIGTDLVLVFPIAHVLANVVHHFGRFNVRTAVARTLKRCHRRSECGIRIRARRRNNARGKRGVIAAAVLHVQNKRRIQNLRFNRGK